MSKPTAIQDRLPLERLRFWQGQMLRSGDLNDHLAIDEEMRRWHNRAIHRAYGIVKGLEVESQIVRSLGRVTTVLVVKPGLAYDGCGGAICLPRAARVALPGAKARRRVASWTLYIRAREASGEATECCFPSQPMRQRPDLFWRPSDLPQSSDCVPVVALRWTGAVTDDDSGTGTNTDAGLSSDIDTENPLESIQLDGSVRVMARPEARPRIAHGATIQGQTAWKEWTIGQFIGVRGGDTQPAAAAASGRARAAAIVAPPTTMTTPMVGMLPMLVSTNVMAVTQVLTTVSKQRFAKRANRANLGIFGVETVIDTSAAGFSGEPVYFAWLRGHPDVSGDRELPTFALGRITESSRNSFTFSALVSTDRSARLNFALRHLYVCWMGVECLPPCADSNEVNHGRPC